MTVRQRPRNTSVMFRFPSCVLVCLSLAVHVGCSDSKKNAAGAIPIDSTGATDSDSTAPGDSATNPSGTDNQQLVSSGDTDTVALNGTVGVLYAGGDTDEQITVGGTTVVTETPPIAVVAEAEISEDVKPLSWEAVYHSTVMTGAIAIPHDDDAHLPSLGVGDIISSGDLGFLRRITAITDMGNETLFETEDVPLEEAFESGSFQFKVGEYEEVPQKKAAPTDTNDGDAKGGSKSWMQANLAGTTLFESEDGNFKLSVNRGTIVATPEFDFKLSVSATKLHLAEIASNGNLLVDMSIKAEGEFEGSISKEKEIPIIKKPAVVLVAGLPVQVTPFVKMVIRVEGSASGKVNAESGVHTTVPLRHNYKFEADVSDKFVYASNGNVNSRPSPMLQTEAEGSLGVKITVDFQAGIEIYSKLSAYIAVGPYLDAKATATGSISTDTDSDGDCTYSLTAGAGGSFNVHLDAIATVIDEKEESWEIFDIPYLLGSGTCKEGASDASGITCKGFTAMDLTGNAEIGWPDNISLCSVIDGDVNIIRNSIPIDLSPLQNIDTITGNLQLSGNTQLATLGGLESLKRVEGDVAIYGNSMLANVDAIGRLTHVGKTLSISGSTVLLDIPAFASLQHVKGIRITDNPALMAVTGFDSVTSVFKDDTESTSYEALIIENNPKLSTLSGFGGIPEVIGQIRVVGGTGSDNLLNNVKRCHSLFYSSMASNVSAFGNLERVDGPVQIYLNGAQMAEALFGALSVVDGHLSAGCAVTCTGFPAFGALTAINGNTLGDNGAALNIEASPNEGVTVSSLPTLSSLGTINGSFQAYLPGSTEDVLAFTGPVSVNGNVSVSLGDATKRFTGLTNLSEVAGYVGVSGIALEEVIGLENLTSAHAVGVSAKIKGPDYSALRTIGDKSADPETLEYWGAFSAAETLETCPKFPALSEIGYVKILNDTIESIDCFTGLQKTQYVQIDAGAATTLTGFSSLTEVGNLFPDTNPAYGGSVYVYAPGLTSAAGLSSLTTVENDVTVRGADALNAMALSGLSTVGGTVSVSSSTENYCATQTWLDSISAAATSISGTAPDEGCE